VSKFASPGCAIVLNTPQLGAGLGIVPGDEAAAGLGVAAAGHALDHLAVHDEGRPYSASPWSNRPIAWSHTTLPVLASEGNKWASDVAAITVFS